MTFNYKIYRRNYREFKKLIRQFITNIDNRPVSDLIYSKIEDNIELLYDSNLFNNIEPKKYNKVVKCVTTYMNKYQNYIMMYFDDNSEIHPDKPIYTHKLNENIHKPIIDDNTTFIKYLMKCSYLELSGMIDLFRTYYYHYISNFMEYKDKINDYKYSWISASSINKLPQRVFEILIYIRNTDVMRFGIWYDDRNNQFICETKWLDTVLEMHNRGIYIDDICDWCLMSKDKYDSLDNERKMLFNKIKKSSQCKHDGIMYNFEKDEYIYLS
jgi:hypothetical protein